ncbi:unnamed protein product [Rotaria sp. Silwood2]|nr:unnamed protein product [Rotaria sp. Silwood2]CAF2623465.1 unnamed protein product [Rotaria sp. Silwood2]CAF2862655.1 unnamed protein product [Rotaria sp. Silwood2]CAF3030254.1 unnamed protein product [Rotaria sp. Silwood2]CAF4145284.1 unnamed protein product [Rotaria sp. Silwood2]
MKISHLSNCSYEEIEELLKREGLDQRFQLNYEHDRKLGSTCQVYYAHDLSQNDQRLVALKFIRTDFIDSFVSYDDLLNLQKTKNCFYKPQTVIYNRRLKNIDNYIPIEQYMGELGRICPHLSIPRCVDNGAKRLETCNAYLIAFEYVHGRTVWENLVRTDFTFLNEYQARTFVRLFIEQLLVLLKHHIIHCDLNGCQNYYYKPYDEINSSKEHYEQWSSSEDGEEGYSSMSGDSRRSSMNDLASVSSSSQLTFIDFGWAICTADPDNDRHEVLLQTLQNLFERIPRVIQIFAGRNYWDFRYAIQSRKQGLKELLNHSWLTKGDIRNENDL